MGVGRPQRGTRYQSMEYLFCATSTEIIANPGKGPLKIPSYSMFKSLSEDRDSIVKLPGKQRGAKWLQSQLSWSYLLIALAPACCSVRSLSMNELTPATLFSEAVNHDLSHWPESDSRKSISSTGCGTIIQNTSVSHATSKPLNVSHSQPRWMNVERHRSRGNARSSMQL